MIRFLTSLIIGAVVTFLLFVLMARLIANDGKAPDRAVENVVIEVSSTPPESQAQTRRPPPPPPPPPPAQPPQAAAPEPDVSSSSTGMSLSMPSIELSASGTGGIGDPSGSLLRDGDATPIVRIEPRYPVQAARDGLEGWVKLRFTIMEDGSVDEVEVIDANPRRVFDREAIRALRRWKYSPKIVDGSPVRQTGQQVQLDFNLESAG